MRKILWVVVWLTSIQSCQALSLVSNGGFESGDFSFWEQFGDTLANFVEDGSEIGLTPPEGSLLALLGAIQDNSGIRQQLNTIAGQAYQISFFLNVYRADENNRTLQVQFDGQTLLDLVDPPADPNWQFYSFTAVASGNSSDLVILAKNVPAYWGLDGVSVEAVSQAAPELDGRRAPLALLFCLGLLGVKQRRL